MTPLPDQEILRRLLLAAVMGGIIGAEREFRQKSAGFRTNILIGMGSALFTIMSLELATAASDPTRITAQIVTGIGFLGAGAIIRTRSGVPRRRDQRGDARHGPPEPLLEQRPALREEPVEVDIVVLVASVDRVAVGGEHGIDELVAGAERRKRELACIGNRHERARPDVQPRAEALEQLGLAPGVHALLSGELVVVIRGGVKRLIRVGAVVTEDRREQFDVVARV